MCGIAGVFGDEEFTAGVIGPMLDVITHRGPDDQGRLTAPAFSFGMRRLSIIDVAGGHQPIWNEDGTVGIVFNGEIYNFLELREELLAAGHTFATNTDTEVIVHLYEEVGRLSLSTMLNKLRGMFGFAIYDVTEQKMILARDQFGIKPLYYRTEVVEGAERMRSFGSEIKSLLQDPRYTPTVNDEAVRQYLSFQFNPLAETFFTGITRLRPGSYAVVDLASGKFGLGRYWTYEFAPPSLTSDDADALAEEIRTTMRDSVEHHMIADVPVGAFLSGGVDSAITVTLIQEQRKALGLDPVKTFTIGFNEVSEIAEARDVAERIGSDHHEIIISIDEYLDVLPKVAWYFDEPVADPSAVSLYFVAREARKHVTVVLSGEGADELFGGYLIYREPLALKPVATSPSWFRRRVVAPLVDTKPEFKGKGYLRRALTPFTDRYIGNAYVFKPHEVRHLWRGPAASHTHEQPGAVLAAEVPGFEAESESRRMQLVDMHYWLAGDILAKADRMTMAHSLELRVPYLDMKVAGLSARIADSLKYRDGTTKWILRRAFESILPQATADRAKLGFPTPVKHWLTRNPDWFREQITTNPYLQSRFDLGAIDRLFAEHAAGTADNARKIYLLTMLALWHQTYFGDTVDEGSADAEPADEGRGQAVSPLAADEILTEVEEIAS